ncbi:OmpA family protein [Paracrocinitomix mangrovi]|uniref:OmpA family protein n=1 Tax=Paracrocinitomix mangrovi TaxID=2862509 RepID=UPI001C8D7BBA|nr:OmpA family protein [Paracrocinitomix mangrovi]UKN00844.1 OmpA family protein [Paracrocinitomix mangrovi]
MKWVLGITAMFLAQFSWGQDDTIKVGLNSFIIADTTKPVNYDSLFAVEGNFRMNHEFYKNRYVETDLMYKITNNKGDGFDSLYGTRNMRPILHGVAYRGGANNYFHKTDKRKNQNPLPLDGMSGLCKEGFSAGVYLYRQNFEESPIGDTCNCVDNSWNNFKYYQYDYYDSSHVYEMIKMTYNAATQEETGPVYLHCWNGWHASGYISAVILKQFCGFSDWDAVNYWDLGTDGANTSPRYQTQRERIKEFQPYPEFMISDSLQKCLCPPMPEHIDSTQLHIEIEHLVVVPEAIPVGFDIVLYNVKFGPGKTTFPGISSNADIINLKKALDGDPNLKIEVGGYTDNSGSYEKNVSLSRSRAKFVYDHLISSGYPEDRITYAGYGPKKPIYSNRYKSTREGNRRIEIKVLAKTVHGGDQLVNEELYNDPNVFDEAALEHSYFSYFLNNQGSNDLGSTFIIDSLIFKSSSAELPVDGFGVEMLNGLVSYMKEHKNVRININGYTDASGIEENNQVLSEERAKAVYNFLVTNGIAENRLYHKGWGSENPIAPNRYKWGRDINRRIEIEFVSD